MTFPDNVFLLDRKYVVKVDFTQQQLFSVSDKPILNTLKLENYCFLKMASAELFDYFEKSSLLTTQTLIHEQIFSNKQEWAYLL